MPRHLPSMAALTAVLLWGGAAIAQDRPEGPPALTQGDGPPEGEIRGAHLFLSPSGEPFRGPDGVQRWFEGADNNHDGAVTLAEFRADAMRFFKVLDANGDGMVDGTENGVYETRIAPEITQMTFGGERVRPQRAPGGGRGGGRRGGMGRGGGDGGGPKMSRGGEGGPSALRREGAARFSWLNIPQPVRGADADLDWKVSAAEWAKAAGQRFALLDQNGDGRLTLDTLPPLPDRRGRPRPGDGAREQR